MKIWVFNFFLEISIRGIDFQKQLITEGVISRQR